MPRELWGEMGTDESDGRRYPPIYLVTGPPGCGKTTALSTLERLHPQIARFGVRDYGLHLAAMGNPLGLAAKDTLLQQGLLPDSLVRDQFVHFLDGLSKSIQVVVVEGYPRTFQQCADLDGALRHRGRHEIAGLVIIEVPDNVALERVTARRICSECGKPSTSRTDCVRCGGPVVVRRDDAAPQFARRLAESKRVGAKLRSHFSAGNLLHVVDGTRSVETVHCRLEELMLGDRSDATYGENDAGRCIPPSTVPGAHNPIQRCL